jgi:hypothetical protein
MPTDNHRNDRKPGEIDKLHGRSEEQPGYETTDVNVGGVIVFLGGLAGFLLIFFVFCFGMGRVINSALEKSDGPVTKWNQLSSFAGAAGTNGKRQDLANNPEMQQKALQQMTNTFPSPRLDIDDGNQATADLHAREDLLLDHYSVAGQPRTMRIPIEQAMEAIAKKGLPVAAQGSAPATELAEDKKEPVQVPLTTGFARTGYELDVMEARAQKMNYGKAEGAEHAELKDQK